MPQRVRREHKALVLQAQTPRPPRRSGRRVRSLPCELCRVQRLHWTRGSPWLYGRRAL